MVSSYLHNPFMKLSSGFLLMNFRVFLVSIFDIWFDISPVPVCVMVISVSPFITGKI
jgi:hypothetical protein